MGGIKNSFLETTGPGKQMGSDSLWFCFSTEPTFDGDIKEEEYVDKAKGEDKDNSSTLLILLYIELWIYGFGKENKAGNDLISLSLLLPTRKKKHSSFLHPLKNKKKLVLTTITPSACFISI